AIPIEHFWFAATAFGVFSREFFGREKSLEFIVVCTECPTKGLIERPIDPGKMLLQLKVRHGLAIGHCRESMRTGFGRKMNRQGGINSQKVVQTAFQLQIRQTASPNPAALLEFG